MAAALEVPEPTLRQAAWFATQRRRLSLGDPELLRDLRPGYLIGVDDAGPPTDDLLRLPLTTDDEIHA